MARKNNRRNTKKASNKLNHNDNDYSINPQSILEDNSEDEFHQQKQSIQLDDNEEHYDFDQDLSEEEVLALDDSSSSEKDYSSQDEEEYENEQDETLLRKISRTLKPQYSDDEVETRSASEDDDDENLDWGKSKKTYYNADQDSEDEELAKEEEAEALRIQRKRAEMMGVDDFMEDFEDVLQNKEEPEDDDETPAKISNHLSKQELLSILSTNSPEILDLITELDQRWTECRAIEPLFLGKDKLKGVFGDGVERVLEYLTLKYQLLTTYTTNISYYLSLVCQAKTITNLQPRTHPSLNVLVQLGEMIKTMEMQVEGKDVEYDSLTKVQKKKFRERVNGMKVLGKYVMVLKEFLASDEFVGLLDDDDDSEEEEKLDVEQEEVVQEPKKPKSKKKKTKKTEEVEQEEQDESDQIKQTSYTEISLPISHATKSHISTTTKRRKRQTNDDYGESSLIEEVDLTDKKRKRRDVQFHVNKLNQTTKTRTLKLLSKPGGDDDLPYKDKYGKTIKLSQQQEVQKPDMNLSLNVDEDELDSLINNLEDEPADEPVQHEFHDDEIEALQYYESMRKAPKPEPSSQDMDLDTLLNVEEEHTGKRPASRLILKNKGLIPHRPKENRNPRVKRRMKYESAVKKLKTFKRVVKDKSQGGAGYVGETTGIKIGLSRSTRLD